MSKKIKYLVAPNPLDKNLTKEINDLDNQVSEIKGIISRLNGKH